MRILLFGADGQVGYELRGPLTSLGDLAALTRADCDVTDADARTAAVEAARPQLIVNATAYNAVDKAEDEPDVCNAVNRDAVRRMGELAIKLRAGLIHMSTDYAFDGRQLQPYRESDEAHPLGVYAQSKVAGERALAEIGAPAIVLRTSWVFSHRKCFLTRMLELACEHETMQVSHDQTSCPTFARDLAVAISMIAHEVRDGPFAAMSQWQGIYHLCGTGPASRWELVREAVARCDRPLAVKRVLPVPSSTFAAKAKRPIYSAMDCSLAEQRFGVRLPNWRDAVRRLFAP